MKLLLYATYALSLPFIFLYQLSLSEMQLYLKLAVELRPSLFGFATVTAFRSGDKRKTSGPSKVFKRTENGQNEGLGPKLDKDPQKRIPTRNRLASVGLVRQYPRAEVSLGFWKIAIQSGYHLPRVIRTSLWISHLIKTNKSEQAVTKGTRRTSTPRRDSKPAAAIALGVAPPLESLRFTQIGAIWRELTCAISVAHSSGSRAPRARACTLSTGLVQGIFPQDSSPVLATHNPHRQQHGPCTLQRPWHAASPVKHAPGACSGRICFQKLLLSDHAGHAWRRFRSLATLQDKFSRR